MAILGIVLILMVAIVALIASSHASGSENNDGQNSIVNVPTTFCKAPKPGQLPGLSREAFDYWTATNPPPTHSQIIMLGDGYGPEIHSLARSVKRYMRNDMSLRMAFDPHMVGQSITSSSSNIITDSAAGATAYSAGQKTYNGAISVVPKVGFNRVCAGISENGKRCQDEGEADEQICCEVDPVAHAFEGCRCLVRMLARHAVAVVALLVLT